MCAREVGEREFQRAVVERSRQIPIVIDFWAPWCGPCRSLAPVLEEAVAALEGRVELVKVNTDENPNLAMQFQIRGIPAVKAMRNGAVVSEFVGVQPREYIRDWLAALVPSEARQAFERASHALLHGDLEAAEDELVPLVDDADVGSAAAMALAEIAFGRGLYDDARAWIARVHPNSEAYTRVDAFEKRLELAAEAERFGGVDSARAAVEAKPDDLEARFALGAALTAEERYEAALEQFFEIMKRQRSFRDGAAHRSILAIFEALGPDSELARQYRRKLQIIT
ncbi:MAG: thioredoxin [Myxococcales bacterium]|nr:thioredoxin [Myxococcales bacterium]